MSTVSDDMSGFSDTTKLCVSEQYISCHGYSYGYHGYSSGYHGYSSWYHGHSSCYHGYSSGYHGYNTLPMFDV